MEDGAAPLGMDLRGDLHLRWQCREDRGAEQRWEVRRVHVVPGGVGNCDVDWPKRGLHPEDRQRAAVVRPGGGVSAVVYRTVPGAREVVDAVCLLVVGGVVAAQRSPDPDATAATVADEIVDVGRDFDLEFGGRTVSVCCRRTRRCDQPCDAQAPTCNRNSSESDELAPWHD